jgi:CheY-like chemotaxis protein
MSDGADPANKVLERIVPRSSSGSEKAEAASILVVDDEPGFLAPFLRLLAREGYRVELAVDGLHGLDMARSGRYAAILLDHQLPGITGLELLQRMRTEGVTTPVVMLTGRGDEAIAFSAAKLGADYYVTKPSDRVISCKRSWTSWLVNRHSPCLDDQKRATSRGAMATYGGRV